MRWQIICTKEKMGVGTTHPKTILTKILKKRFITVKTSFQFFVVYIYLIGTLTNGILGKHILLVGVSLQARLRDSCIGHRIRLDHCSNKMW